VAIHAKNSLRRACITQVLDLPLTITALEAVGTKGLVTGENGQVLNLVATTATTICAIIAYQGAITKKEEIRVRVEEGATGIAFEATDVPSVARCTQSALNYCQK
jgi:hypothetical protein